jgi:hypothetical protein
MTLIPLVVHTGQLDKELTLSLLMSYICGAPCKDNSFLTSYIHGLTFGNAESRLFLFDAQCFNTESMQKVFLCHSCVVIICSNKMYTF